MCVVISRSFVAYNAKMHHNSKWNDIKTLIIRNVPQLPFSNIPFVSARLSIITFWLTPIASSVAGSRHHLWISFLVTFACWVLVDSICLIDIAGNEDLRMNVGFAEGLTPLPPSGTRMILFLSGKVMVWLVYNISINSMPRTHHPFMLNGFIASSLLDEYLQWLVQLDSK